jgi:hypothetical protein
MSAQVVIMSAWIQQRVIALDFFGSALFCLWLSTASLTPLLLMEFT